MAFIKPSGFSSGFSCVFSVHFLLCDHMNLCSFLPWGSSSGVPPQMIRRSAGFVLQDLKREAESGFVAL